MDGPPVFSVVVPAYREGEGVATALDALAAQRFDEPYEVIVVDSGVEDSCAAFVAERYPGVRLVHSDERLRCGAAFNAGVRAARGDYVGFVPADGRVTSNWIAARVAVHRAGFRLVGGSVANGTPRSVVGTAGYLLEYTSVLPRESILRGQEIPHALSFERSVFDEVGLFPEDTITGEDTLLGSECVRRGIAVGYAPQAAFEHQSLTSLVALLRHVEEHGRGLAQCAVRHDLDSSVRPRGPSRPAAAWAALVTYPRQAFTLKLRRLARHAPDLLPRFVAVSPIVALGLLATGVGAWRELSAR